MHRIEREYGTLYNEYTRVKRARKSVARGARGGRGWGGAWGGGAGWGVGVQNVQRERPSPNMHTICIYMPHL